MIREGHITVVGSNMIDLTTYLNRIPIKGETVFGKEFQQGFGGKGSNQAVMASLLGANVSIVTAVGEDAYGKQWLQHYKNEGIRTEAVKIVKEKNSGIASIWVETDGDNRIVITPGANDDLLPEFVASAFKQLTQTDVVLSQLENPQDAILEGFKRGKELGAITILNPAPADILMEGILTYTDWLVPNESELIFLAKKMFKMDSTDLIETTKAFANKTDTNLVVTLGANGALIYRPGSDTEVITIPTIQVDTKDTTGAGDAFCGTFAYGLSVGMDPDKAIKLANVVASDSVQRNGTQASYARGTALEQLVKQVL